MLLRSVVSTFGIFPNVGFNSFPIRNRLKYPKYFPLFFSFSSFSCFKFLPEHQGINYLINLFLSKFEVDSEDRVLVLLPYPCHYLSVNFIFQIESLSAVAAS